MIKRTTKKLTTNSIIIDIIFVCRYFHLLPRRVKKSLESGYPRPMTVDSRIHGDATVISFDMVGGMAIITLPRAEHVGFQAVVNNIIGGSFFLRLSEPVTGVIKA